MTGFRFKKSAIWSIDCRLYSRMDDDNDPVPLGMKTKVDILNEIEDYVMFNGYSPGGFLLNNNTRIPGPIIAFPKVIFQWNVSA